MSKRTKLRNNSENLYREYNDDEDRVDRIIGKSNRQPVQDIVKTIIPQNKVDYDHEKAFNQEGIEILKRANLLASYIAIQMERFLQYQDLDNYFIYLNSGRELLDSIDNKDYNTMLTLLERYPIE